MIIIIYGPAACGKTTIANNLKKRLEDQGYGFRIIHSDDYKSNTYDRILREVNETDYDLIIDGTFYKKKWRDMFRDKKEVKFINIDTGIETCLKRNKQRSDPIEEKAVYIIYNSFEDGDYDLKIDSDDKSVEEIIDLIIEQLDLNERD